MNTLGIIALVNFNDWENPDYRETGGINSVIKNLLPYLKADKIILFGFTNKREDLFHQKIIQPNIVVIPIFHVPLKAKLPIRLFGLLFGWRIRKYIKSNNIKHIYSHAEELAIWLPFDKIHCVHHIHTYVNVLRVSSRKMASIKVFHNFWERLRRQVIKRSHKVIAVNQDVANLIETISGKEKVIHFPNYVDYSKFKYVSDTSLRKEYDHTKKIVLHVGRISRIKGLELFADTIQALNKKEKNNWIGLLVGSGEYENAIRLYVANKNLQDSIHFIGSINDTEKLAEYYSLANVFLLTSWSESVPLTLLESLACGTPVVSTNVGIARLVLGNSNGFVVNSRNPDEFAEKITESILYKVPYNIISEKRFYSVDHAAHQLNKIFNAVKN